jgi:hypothetical protein
MSTIYFLIICYFKSDFIPFIVEYISKCSLTVRPSNIVSNYGQYPIIFLAYWNPLEEVISCPNIDKFPYDGYNSPVKHLKHVDLPAPDIPKSAKHSPNSSPNDTSFTANLFPKYFVI